MANATPQDAKKNEAIIHAMIDQESPYIAAKVGLHALAKLSELMPHKEFAEFVSDAVQEATTGQQPAEENEGAEGQ